jgi:hypothetical protein
MAFTVCFTAILKFIQPIVLSLLLKPMDQSQLGGIQAMEAKVHLRIRVTPKFLQLALRAAKALLVE